MAGLLLGSRPAQAANALSWQGLGSTGNWSDKNNWNGVNIPGPGDTLLFPGGQPRPNNTNDIAGLTLNTVVFWSSSGGYSIYGNALTLTNSLQCTNTSGANSLYPSISLGSQDLTVNVGAGASLTLFGNITGSAGVTKAGTGTLTYQAAGNNSYSGTTRVNAGALLLNVSGATSFGGPLIVGDGSGSGSPVVRWLQSTEVYDYSAITLNRAGLLDLNGFSDTIGNLTLNDNASVTTGSGKLTAGDNTTIAANTSSSSYSASIAGNLVIGNTSCTLAAGPSATLVVTASIGGAGAITKNGSGGVRFFGSNYFTGALTIQAGYLDVLNSYALGTSAGGTTINGTAILGIYNNVNINGESLTLNSSYNGSLWVGSGNNTWAGNVSLTANTTVYVPGGCSLAINGPISGSGSLTKIGAGLLTLGGSSANSFTGATVVNEGELDLAKPAYTKALAGPLVIGDGSGSETVRLLAGEQIWSIAVPVTINSGGLLDLNGFTDAIGPLTFQGGGQINTGAGQIQLYTPVTVVPGSSMASINGNVFLDSSPKSLVITNTGHNMSPDLAINASISGPSGIGITKTGFGELSLTASNSFSGPVVVANGSVQVYNSYALGNTANSVTVNNGAGIYLSGSLAIGSNPLTLNGRGWDTSIGALRCNYGSSSWAGNITLASDSTVDVETNAAPTAALTLTGVVSGPGGLTKIGPGTLQLFGSSGNSYTGSTFIQSGLCLLDKASGTAIPSGPLTIGDNFGSTAIVRDINVGGNIGSSVPVTINNNSLLDLNGENEYVGLITLDGGAIQTGTGMLTMNANLVSTNSTGTNHTTSISGYLALGAANRTFSMYNELDVPATVSGSGGITVNGTPLPWLHLSGNNSYAGLTVLQSGGLWVESDLALGSTAGGTVVSNGASLVLNGGVAITNETLVLNGPGPNSSWGSLDSETRSGIFGPDIWAGPITLNADSTIDTWYTDDLLRIIGPISGPGGFTQFGSIPAGTLQLEGPSTNTYAGTTTVKAGTLVLAKNGTAPGLAIPGNLVLNSNTTVRLAAHYQLWSASKALTMADNALFDLANYTDCVGRVNLTGAQITTGSGMLMLSDTVTINPSLVAQSQISGTVQLYVYSTLTFTNTGHNYSPDLLISACIFGLGPGNPGFIKTGPGEISLTASNSFPGSVTVDNGNLLLAHPYALGNLTSPATVNPAGNLSLKNVAIGAKPLVLSGGLNVVGGTGSWAGPITLADNARFTTALTTDSLGIGGPISGTGNPTFTGSGAITLSNSVASTYTGTAFVTAGTLQLKSSAFDGAIPHDLSISDSSVSLLAQNQIYNGANVTLQGGSSLLLNGHIERVGTLSGTGTVDLGSGSSYLVIGDSSNNGSSTYSGLIKGSASLWKDGTGTLTLTGNNSYSGQTIIYNGKLLVNGSQPASDITVQTGTLAGVGTVGQIYCQAGLAPGNSPGRLTSSNLTFTTSGSFQVELTGPTPGANYDQLVVHGTNSLANAALVVNPAFSQPAGLGQQFVIIDNQGTAPITGTFNGLTNGATVSAGGYAFRVNYDGGNGNDVVLTLTGLPAAQTGSSLAGNYGNGNLNPDQCATLNLLITNQAGTPMTGISGQLTSAEPNVLVTQPTATYANAAAYGLSSNLTPFQISVLSSFPCGSNINLTLTLTTATHGTFAVPITLLSGEAGLSAQRFDVSGNFSIPDVGTLESTNTVTGFVGPVMKVAASLYLTHSYDQDLTSISLIAPDGTTVLLSSGNGGGGQNYGASCSPDASCTTFDDAAPTPITAGFAPFTGTYRPQGSLASLVGTSANGNWRLRIQDGFGGSLGTLRCWSLFLYPVTCAPGGGACALCGTSVTNVLTSEGTAQIGRLLGGGLSSGCGAPKPFPGIADSLPRYYHAYPFYNGRSNACITITLASNSGGNHFSAAYLGSFNPSNLSQNYLGALGNSTGGGPLSYSLDVPANTVFIVTVNEVGTTLSYVPYRLTVSGGDCAPVLLAQPAGPTAVAVKWPILAGLYQLESCAALLTNAWWDPTNVPFANSNRFSITNQAVAPAQFYRLHKQ